MRTYQVPIEIVRIGKSEEWVALKDEHMAIHKEMREKAQEFAEHTKQIRQMTTQHLYGDSYSQAEVLESGRGYVVSTMGEFSPWQYAQHIDYSSKMITEIAGQLMELRMELRKTERKIDEIVEASK